MIILLWGDHFIEAQGYTVDKNKLYQDNNNTILMENNERALSSKITKHVKLQFFFNKGSY